MADYKINFEYKGIGKQASGIRQKILQSQKGDKKGGITTSGTRETLTSLKALNTSILKLIASNKELSRSISSGGGGMGGGVSGRGGGGPGIGKVGAALPIAGAAIALTGFAIQKINQIGNAYMSLANQQKASVGIGGFRQRGQGMYLAGEIGAGMKAYGMATGQFVSGVDTEKKGLLGQRRTALDVGAIYGLSAAESLQTAGQFKRAGANYQGAVFAGAGAGIESELPMLLTGMANILTDAVRDGVNTSDMSKDMAREISAITMATPGKSVEAALNMVKGFSGVKKQIAGGKMGTYQALEMTKASQQILLEKLTKTDYASKLMERGAIDEDTFSKLTKLKQGATFSDLMSAAGGAAFPMLRRSTEETGTPQIMKQVRKNLLKKGDSPKLRDRISEIILQTGWAGLDTQSKVDSYLKTGEVQAGLEGKGIIGKKAEKVTGGKVGLQIGRQQRKEDLVFTHGARFAEMSIAFEKAMISIINTLSKDEGLSKALMGVSDAAIGAANGFSRVEDTMNKYRTKIRKSIGLKTDSPEKSIFDFLK